MGEACVNVQINFFPLFCFYCLRVMNMNVLQLSSCRYTYMIDMFVAYGRRGRGTWTISAFMQSSATSVLRAQQGDS